MANSARDNSSVGNAIVKYIIRVKTGQVANAGTDSSVYITLYGKTNKTDKILLSEVDSKRDGKLFAKGKLDEFHIKAPNVGKIVKINIGHSADGEKRSWFLDYVQIRCGDANYKFDAKEWMDKEDNNGKTSVELHDTFDLEVSKGYKARTEQLLSNSERLESNFGEYQVKVRTGDKDDAGTDGKVTITIYGARGSSTGLIQLNNSNSLNDDVHLFGTASVNHFKFTAPLVEGNLHHISIGHDGSGSAQSWNLESVHVIVNHLNYGFSIGRWLDVSNSENYIDVKPASVKSVWRRPHDKPKSYDQYVRAEFYRLKSKLETESSKIVFPKRKEFKPFIFNTLHPYYDTRLIEHLLDMPVDDLIVGHFNRVTANNPVDPWVDLQIDRTVPSLKLRKSKLDKSYTSAQLIEQSSARPEKTDLQGSTLAPSFPKISMKKPRNMTGPFYVSDIDVIRKEIRKTVGAGSVVKYEEDKTRTVNDFYRMKLDHFHPSSKATMIQTYRAYLENTSGSKRGLDEVLQDDNFNSSSSSQFINTKA